MTRTDKEMAMIQRAAKEARRGFKDNLPKSIRGLEEVNNVGFNFESTSSSTGLRYRVKLTTEIELIPE